MALGADAEIAARIAAAVHEPFRDAWRLHAEEVWGPVRRALEAGAAAHDRAMEELAGAPAAADAEGDGAPGEADRAPERYRRAVAANSLDPLRAALRDHDAAGKLEAALARAGERVAAAVDGLPELVRAPLSPAALRQARGLGARVALKRLCALALRPLVWRRDFHDVPAALVARGHVADAVLPRQMRAFRESQRLRAAWLGGVERAWSEWSAAALARGRNDREACAEAGEALHRRLLALAGQVDLASGRGLRDGLVGQCGDALGARVGVAGTFVAVGYEGEPVRWRGQRELAARWDRWAGESAARLDLCLALLAARRRVDGIRRELLAEWTRAVREVGAGLDEIDARLEAGGRRAAGLDARDAGLPDALKRERRRAALGLGEAAGTLPDPGQLLDVLAGAAVRADRRLVGVAAQTPEELVVHRVPHAGSRLRRPRGPGSAVRLREAVRLSFDAPRIERIRAAASVVPGAMDRVLAAVSELREVAEYGYEAAIAELTEGGDPEAVHPMLVANGLARASARTEAARRALFDALGEARSRVSDEVAEGMAHLVQRATTDPLTGRYLDARSQVAADASRGRERWRRRISEAMRRGSAAFSWIRRRLWPVKHALGIGAGSGSPAELRERSMAAVEEVERKLPVLYRRLFALEPVADPRLLAGRDDALAAVEASWHRWRAEPSGALVVIASPGAGVTSFLNVAAGRLGGDARLTARRTVRPRIRDEAELAARLGGWLGLDGARDLDGLGSQVLDAPRGALPRHFIVEGTEHLHMRVAGGGDVFEALLSFTQRTAPRIFWVLSIGASAWQLVEKRCAACVGDIERIRLAELTAGDLKRAVLARHRLSGLPLRYLERRTGRELLRRRPGLRGSEKHQRLLESDHFERLHRASLGSVRAALFHWLRSADFHTEEGSVLVRPLEALPSLMDGFDVERSFALKALLDHGTLTVAEYCEVARISPAEGRHLFRAMRDLHVIEAVPEDGPGGSRGSAGGARHRIRPLVVGAAAAHLRSLNILH